MTKPHIEAVPLSVGLQWKVDGNYLYQEKSDGKHCFFPFLGSLFNTEKMASGEIVFNDILNLQGQDLTRETTFTRWKMLSEWFSSRVLPDSFRLCKTGNGGEFLQRILDSHGEGVIAKQMLSPFGVNWFKCKRVQVFYCVITAIDFASGSVHIADSITMQPRGKLALYNRLGKVRIGSILKVEAFWEHKSGLLREARLCKDTETSWLKQY